MAPLTSATGEGCEYEKSSAAAIDPIDGGGGSRKSSPGPDDGVIELNSSGKSSPGSAFIGDGEIEHDSTHSSGNSSPDTAAIDGISSSEGQEHRNYLDAHYWQYIRESVGQVIYITTPSGMELVFVSPLVAGRHASQALVDASMTDFAGLPPDFARDTSGTRGPFSSVHLDTRLPDGRDTRLPDGRAFMEVEPGNWETGRLITGLRFGRGLADLTPMSPDFRLEIMDEPQDANEQQLSRLNQAMIVLFVASELSATAYEIKYETSQMVAYFFMCTLCLMSAMCTAHLLAPLEGGTERFSVYLRGFSFVFLGLLRILGVNQASFVTALKIILGMSQVVLYWWTAGILQTYMNAFGMRRT